MRNSYQMSQIEEFLQGKKTTVTREEIQKKIEEVEKRLISLEKKLSQSKPEIDPSDQIILDLLNEINKQWKATGIRAKKAE